VPVDCSSGCAKRLRRAGLSASGAQQARLAADYYCFSTLVTGSIIILLTDNRAFGLIFGIIIGCNIGPPLGAYARRDQIKDRNLYYEDKFKELD
jgi:hypothetical protein